MAWQYNGSFGGESYRELGDEEFIRFADFLRLYYAAYAVLFVVVLAIFMTNIAMNGTWGRAAK